jgi:dihydrofolate reductase
LGMSLDGFIAGPNAGPDNALGDGGMRIHRWVYDLEAWRERQGLTDGPGSALEQARTAAGDKDIQIAGGAYTIQQFLEAGLLDELQIHLAPLLLGDGVRLFEHIHPERVELEPTRVIDSPRVTHLRYRVVASENGGLEV